MPARVKSKTDRMMARVALIIIALGALYGIYAFSAPLYYRFVADVVKPFDSRTELSTSGVGPKQHIEPIKDDPFAEGVLLSLKKKPSAASAVTTTPAVVAAVVTTNPATTTIERQLEENQKAVAQVVAVGPRTQPIYNPATYKSEDYPLTKERVRRLAKDGYIMITWANHHYLDFAMSWVYHVRKLGLTSYMVGAMDDDMLQSLAKADVTTWRMDTGIHKGDLGWGSANFHKMGRFKINLIKQFLELDVTMIISDIDTTWLRDPIPYFKRYPDADVLTSTDELHETVPDEKLENPRASGASFNIGIMMFRKSSIQLNPRASGASFIFGIMMFRKSSIQLRNGSKALDDPQDKLDLAGSVHGPPKPNDQEWIKSLDDPKMWDQTAFNQLARRNWSEVLDNNLFKGYDGKLNIGILPASIFSSGHMFFVQTKYKDPGLEPYVAQATFQYSGTDRQTDVTKYKELGLEPYVAHATFQYSGTPGKRHRFREFKLWDDPPEYYDSPNGFISMTIDIPTDLWEAAKKPITGPMTPDKLDTHFKLVHFQIAHLRTALTLATLTGRVVIMPPIWCQIDKYWAPLDNDWYRKMDLNHFGPHIEWREYSFLENERMKPEVRNSRVELAVCDTNTANCDSTKIIDGKLNVPLATTAPELTKLLKQLVPPSTKILHLPFGSLNVFKLLWKSMAREEMERFEVRSVHLTGTLCCLSTNPGWVWYDMLAGVEHKDRFRREYPGGEHVLYRGDSKVDLKEPSIPKLGLRRLMAGGAEGAGKEDGVSLGYGQDLESLGLTYQDAMMAEP
eukprot:gene1848-33268_t